jgi:hypothetical protein
MDYLTKYRKLKAPVNTQTHNVTELMEGTGNVYASTMVMTVRANQITKELKEELDVKLADFALADDSLDEVFEDDDQIELSRAYEELPKPVMLAQREYFEGALKVTLPLAVSEVEEGELPQKA